MRVILCDRCGVKMKKGAETPVKFGWPQINGFEAQFDFCGKCADELYQEWCDMRNKVGGDEIEGKGI